MDFWSKANNPNVRPLRGRYFFDNCSNLGHLFLLELKKNIGLSFYRNLNPKIHGFLCFFILCLGIFLINFKNTYLHGENINLNKVSFGAAHRYSIFKIRRHRGCCGSSLRSSTSTKNHEINIGGRPNKCIGGPDALAARINAMAAPMHPGLIAAPMPVGPHRRRQGVVGRTANAHRRHWPCYTTL